MVSMVATIVCVKVTIASNQRPVTTIAINKAKVKSAIRAPANTKATITNIVKVMNHGARANISSIGFSTQIDIKSLKATVENEMSFTKKLTKRLVAFAIGVAISILVGKLPKDSTKCDAITAITVKAPVMIKLRRRTLNCFSVGGINDCCFVAAALVARSNKIARKTTAKPATKPWPVF